jgi:hypothetical protein
LPRAALGLSRLQRDGALSASTLDDGRESRGRALRILDLLVDQRTTGKADTERGAAQLWKVLAELGLVRGFGSAREQLRPLR